MTLVAEQNPVVHILGWSDDVTECMHCGRVDLRGTLICEHADGSISYMGSVCGVHAFRWGRSLVRREDAKAARELEKVAHDADHQRQVAAWQAYCNHPLKRRADEVYRQREVLHLPPGRAALNHPLTREYQALEAQAKADVAAAYGVKRVYFVS